jgi:hypothetical protein
MAYKKTYITTVSGIDKQIVKPTRAGVIFYTNIRGEYYIGLGKDTKTNDLTDFSGGIRYKKDINVIRGALRECKEETLGLFYPKEDDIQNCSVVYDNNNLVIFIPVYFSHPLQVSKQFTEKYNLAIEKHKIGKERMPEVCAFTWITLPEFKDLLYRRGSGVLFSRVRNFLVNVGYNNIENVCKVK